MRQILVIIFQVLVVLPLQGQIGGRITESRSNKAVPEAEIFIQGKSVSALSDEEGNFALDGMSPGFNDVIVYKKGYQLFKSSIRLEKGKAYSVNLTLSAAKGNKSKKKELTADQVNAFLQVITGTLDSTGPILTNRNALRLETKNDVTSISTDEPLLIIHENLGYQIRYYLSEGSLSKGKIKAEGYFTFIPLQPRGSEEAIRWATNRLNLYQGSLRHMLSSLVSGSTAQPGFEFIDAQGQSINPAALVAPSIPNYRTIKIETAISVRFKDARGMTNTSQLIPHGSLQTTNEGNLLIRNNLEVTGAMATRSNPLLLPLDYAAVMPAADDFMKFYEKVYVQTDKPYYYPGEPLWFKGYVNYFNPAWRDSLSQVVYVEIIHPKKSVILSRTLRLDSGFFYGDFILPDTVSAGGYFLRAYTQLSRNYGDDNLFMKSIPILNMTDKADPAQAITESTIDNIVSIITDKPRYNTREKITLGIQLKDKNGKPLASNLSISVTDAVQVVPVPEQVNILTGYAIDRSRIFNNVEFKYPAEFGVGYAGRFLNDKGKPEKTSLSILRLKPRSVLFADTNEEGYFTQTGLNFYDTATFAFKSDKAKESPYGKVQILPRDNPPITISGSSNPIIIQKTGTAQRLISEYEVPKDTKLLQTVEVKASRLPSDERDQADYRMKRPYGRGDYVLEAKDINTNYGNLLYAMQGRFPGLVVRQIEGGWAVYAQRATANSFSSPTGILVTINDVAMGGNAADILSSINPNTVESIEVTTRVNLLYGSLGANGVISIHTKQDASDDQQKMQNFQMLVVHGYSPTRSFNHPQYDDPGIDRTKADYRATLYWNPFVATKTSSGATSVSFFSSDLPGRYRVVVEGVDGAGEPVRAVMFVVVESN